MRIVGLPLGVGMLLNVWLKRKLNRFYICNGDLSIKVPLTLRITTTKRLYISSMVNGIEGVLRQNLSVNWLLRKRSLPMKSLS